MKPYFVLLGVPCAVVAQLRGPTPPGIPMTITAVAADPGETRNLYFEQPQIVRELRTLLEQSKASGRSRPMRLTKNP